jgi:hypothetical protein
MISAVCIHHKHPEWKSPNTVKGGDFFKILAMSIAVYMKPLKWILKALLFIQIKLNESINYKFTINNRIQ